MKKILRLFSVIVVCIIYITLTSCNNSPNDDRPNDYIKENRNNNSSNTDNNYSSDQIVKLNLNNVGYFFNLKLEINDKYYDTGKMLYYTVRVSVKNCIINETVTLKFDITAIYNTNTSSFKYKSYDYVTINVFRKSAGNSYSGSIFLTKDVDEVNVNLECKCTYVTGSINAY